MASSQPTSRNLDFGHVLEFKMDAKCFDDVVATLRAKDAALEAQKAALDTREAAVEAREAALDTREEALHEWQRSLLARERGDSIVSPRDLTSFLGQAANMTSPIEAGQSVSANVATSSPPAATATAASSHHLPTLEAAESLLALQKDTNATSSAAQPGVRTNPSRVQVDIPDRSIHIDTVRQSIRPPQGHSSPLRERRFIYVGAPLRDQMEDSQPDNAQTQERLEELAIDQLRAEHYSNMWINALNAGDPTRATTALFEATRSTAGVQLGQDSATVGASIGAVPSAPQQSTDERTKAPLERLREENAGLGVADRISPGRSGLDASGGEFGEEEESADAGAAQGDGTEEGVGRSCVLAEAVSGNISQLLREDAGDESKEERSVDRE